MLEFRVSRLSAVSFSVAACLLTPLPVFLPLKVTTVVLSLYSPLRLVCG